MSNPAYRILRSAVAVLALAIALPGVAASPPTLFSIGSGKVEVLAQGAQKAWPIKVSEDSAINAIFQGGMWLPNPAGGQIYAKYQRHIIHANGTWTWIGKVSTVHGPRSVILTFGKEGVFGDIPQAQGYPLRIVTDAGGTHVIATSAQAMAASAQALRLHSQPDFFVPPRSAPKGKASAPSASGVIKQAVQTNASGTVTIDVMVAYTPGFVTELGSASNALTRIQNLVDLTNQAYIDSQVNQQIRLVDTVEVNYPDNTSNSSALDDITGVDQNGNPVPIPSSLQNIASLRVQYGADLVTLIRSFDNSTQGGCGIAWLVGGNEATIVPSQDNAYGYNVVSDGSSGGYYCLATTFAHELGHNMGNAHDRANASTPGAYSYSYGYLGNGTNGFSTIMAYGSTTDTPVSVFSNPNISSCQNTPCGVADNSSSSADNAHSMNNTASLIAQFEPTEVGNTAKVAHNDVNGDGKTDLLFNSSTAHNLVYWIMSGPTWTGGWRGFAVNSTYTPSGTGDLNGDGRVDLLWSDGTTLYVWLNDGKGGFTAKTILPYPSGGWYVLGTGDVNGDGKDDIIWYNQSQHKLVYWLMSGSTYLGYKDFAVTSNFTPAGMGDLNGDGHVDLLWTDTSNNIYAWLGNGTTFTQKRITTYPSGGWYVAGVGDVDGNGDDDIIWFNLSQHKLVYWLMNGATYLGYKDFAVDPSFQFAGIGDYDGNGYTDVLWTTSANNLYMWLGNGSTFTQDRVSVSSYAAGYTPLQ
jgi:hypothetical protein